MVAGLSSHDARGSALAALRGATAPSHARIEALLGLHENIPLDRYARILQGFDQFLSAWEPRVRQALPAGLHGWLAQRSRHPMLRRDLAVLDIDRRAQDTASFAWLDGTAAAFGSLYVIEGSALGGQVIARQMARSRGLGPATGCAYFEGHGERTGAMWREFGQLLEQQVGSAPEARAEACGAAVATFDTLCEVFEDVLDERAAA